MGTLLRMEVCCCTVLGSWTCTVLDSWTVCRWYPILLTRNLVQRWSLLLKPQHVCQVNVRVNVVMWKVAEHLCLFQACLVLHEDILVMHLWMQTQRMSHTCFRHKRLEAAGLGVSTLCR